MKRRTYLGSLGIAGISVTAGCLDDLSGRVESAGDDSPDRPEPSEDTVLGPPERDLSASGHPTYGEEFPSLSLPDPLAGEEVSTEDLAGERAFLLTFVYSNCHDDSCPLLLSRLAHAQSEAADAGVDDEVAFLAMTFDPERDTESVLREEGQAQGADLEAGNWHFLRPDTFDEAATILDDEFGLKLDRSDLDEHDHGDEDGHDSDSSDGGDDSDEHSDDSDGHADGSPDEDESYSITHYNLILLVNEEGYVERAYPNATSVEWSVISEDLLAVVEG